MEINLHLFRSKAKFKERFDDLIIMFHLPIYQIDFDLFRLHLNQSK